MQVVRPKKRITAVDLRARVPAIARGLALLLLIGGAVFVGVSYYKMRNNTPFRLIPKNPELSKRDRRYHHRLRTKVTRMTSCICGCAPRAT
jgi:hypothetical protein